jgi:hypothetical protein
MAIGLEEDLDFENEDTIFKVGEKEEPDLDPSLLVNFPKMGQESPKRKPRIRETTGGTVVMGSDDGNEGSKGRTWLKGRGREGKEKLVDARLVFRGDEVGLGRASMEQASTFVPPEQNQIDIEDMPAEDLKGKGKEKAKKGILGKLGFKRKGDAAAGGSETGCELYTCLSLRISFTFDTL